MNFGRLGLVLAIILAFATPIFFFLANSENYDTKILDINSSVDYKDQIEKTIYLEKNSEVKVQVKFQGSGHVTVIIINPEGKKLQYGEYRWGQSSSEFRELYFSPKISGNYSLIIESNSKPASWIEYIVITKPKSSQETNEKYFSNSDKKLDSRYAIFQNPQYGFSLNYPKEWKIDSRVESYDSVTELVYFTPNLRIYDPSIFVSKIKDGPEIGAREFNDKYKQLQEFENTIKNDCLKNHYYVFTCEDYKTLEKRVYEINGENYFQITHQWNEIWSDGYEQEVVRIETLIPDSEHYWEITLYSSSKEWKNYLEEYFESVKSFKTYN